MRAQWLLALGVAVVACGGERPPSASPAAAPSPPSWSEVERLQKKRHFDAARAQVDALLTAARASGDDAAAGRALLRGAQLRAIAGYPEALRFLRSETWPTDPLARATLHLYAARTKVIAYRGGGDDVPTPAPDTSLTVHLQDTHGEVVQTAAVTTNAWGTASGRFDVPAGRVAGQWIVRAPDHPTIGGAVRVEVHDRPRIEVRFVDADPPVRLGQPVTLTAEVRDERGRPVTTGVATWRVTREPIDGPARRPAPRGKRFVRYGQRPLDAAGRFDVTFTPEADAEDAAFAFPVLVDVASPRGAARNVEARVLAGALTRVKATIEPTARFFDAGERGAVKVRRAHLDGSPAPGQGRWRLVRLTAPADAPADPESRPADLATVLRDWTDGPTVAQGTAAHGPDGIANLTLPAASAGAYRLRYATADATGAAFEAEHDLLITAPTMALDLPTVFEVKHATVPAGGFVEVFLHTAPPGQHLILERWRGAERVEGVTWIAGQDPTRLRFPVTDADRGGLTFDLLRVRDQRWLSARRVVEVPWTSKRLSVAIEAQPPTPGADESTTWRVRVTGPDGAGVAAEVVASVDDARIERRAPHRVQTLEGVYPRQRRTPNLSATVPEVRVARPASKPGPRWLGWKRPQAPTLPVFARYPFQPPDTPPAVVDHAFERTWGFTLGVPPPTGAGARWSSGPLRAPGDHGGSFGFGLDLRLPPDVGETPLWLPHLTTGADGTATFTGPPPDAGRAWTVWAHALGPGWAGGTARTTTAPFAPPAGGAEPEGTLHRPAPHGDAAAATFRSR
ncbi:MAG: hypothetical protein H6704_11430 [Myxococcales bacterium]|nr:hypothetical protein [Myxococcales bacterium]